MNKIHLLHIYTHKLFHYHTQQPTSFNGQNVRYLGLYLNRSPTLAAHICNKQLVLNNRQRQLHLVLSFKNVTLHDIILLYKLLLKLIQSYSIPLWRSAKHSNVNKILTLQSKYLRQITKAQFYVSNVEHYTNAPILNQVPNMSSLKRISKPSKITL